VNTSLRAFPPAQTLGWVGREVGGRVVAGRRLTGGITSSVHRLSVERRDGKREQVVLRRWVESQYTDDESAQDRVEREVFLLSALERTDIPTPRVLAADATGADAGVPALLMSRVPGRVELSPSDPEAWLRQMVSLLIRIHALDIAAPTYFSWLDEQDAAALGPPTAYEAVFIHRDYQHFNLLWQRGRLTGIVDWVYACRGSADVDIGHCRANLAVLYSVELAERFREIYESEAGRSVDPYWDLTELVVFEGSFSGIARQVAGRRHFDAAGAPARMEALIAAARCRL
jgi:aminoglycoside phosphotransferase (APT) family kinase protein